MTFHSNTNAATPLFYCLPASDIEPGMSTDDGQTIVETTGADLIFLDCYTPSDDPEIDQENLTESHVRDYLPDDLVGLAVFADTEIDGSDYDTARPHPNARR